MEIPDVTLRLLLITIFSGLIGFERERQNAHAGLRTHLIVGITATIIALIQQEIIHQVIALNTTHLGIAELVRSDPARLIAQVVSGIGFLGAGTIIVTKRNISGLTTAASIWSVSGLGLAIGMGYLTIATIGFLFLFCTLVLIKKIFAIHYQERVYIEYIKGSNTIQEIEQIFNKLDIKGEHISFKTKPFGNELIYASVFDVKGPKSINYQQLVSEMSKNPHIASIELTNLN